MSRLTQLKHASRAARRVIRRRVLEGPRRPSWSFKYELLIESIIEQMNDPDAAPLPERRLRFDAMGEAELRRDRVRFEVVEANGVPAEWVVPSRARSDAALLYLHGGGYVIGSPRSHRTLLASVAHAADMRILAIDYRLAPEHPCPAAIEDATRAYRWLLERGQAPERLAIGGDSAGGGLTLATAVTLRDEGTALPAGLVVLSPWTDLREETAARRVVTGCDYLSLDGAGDPAGDYAGGLTRDDPRVSPICAELKGLPPIMILAGGQELLLSDSLELAARARAAGVDVSLHVEEDEVHVYPFFADATPRAAIAFGRMAEFLRASTGG